MDTLYEKIRSIQFLLYSVQLLQTKQMCQEGALCIVYVHLCSSQVVEPRGVCINIHMNNKTNNMFRFKVKKPRQTCIQLDKRPDSPQQDPGDSFSRNKVGFSSQYITLAKKFNIKIVTGHSQGKIRGNQIQSIDFMQERLKTQFSKTKSRYFMMETPANKLELRHHSFWLNERQGDLSSRREKRAMVKLNKNTVYNDMFFRLKTDDSKDLPSQQPLKLSIRKGDDILTNLGRHCQKLFTIKQAIDKKETNANEAIREIKAYILREEGASISKLDSYFLEDHLRKQVKELLIMERLALLSIVANILSHHFEQLAEVSSRTVEVILGFWYQVLNHTYSSNIFQLQIQQNSPVKEILQTLSQAKLLTKGNIKLLLQTVGQKLAILYKHLKPLYKQISFLTGCSHSLSINRAFYQLLTLFAGFITHYENQHRVMLDSVTFFATAPSPYLVKAPSKPYTLVVDLDETLIYLAPNNSKDKGKDTAQVENRPGSVEFMSELSKYYEMVVFTTAVQSYAREAAREFEGIDHFLFRQHAVRVKSGFIKDLSRLGRDLNKVIIVDDTTNSFKLQKENAIKVNSWKGDPNDTELQEVKQLLLKLAEDKPAKITTFLQQHKKQPSKKTSSVLSPLQEKPPL